MARWLGVLTTLTRTACAPGLNQLNPTLGADDSGTIWFSSDERYVLSGELIFPPGLGPFPAVLLMHGAVGCPRGPSKGGLRC